jgi:hypothetical protein
VPRGQFRFSDRRLVDNRLSAGFAAQSEEWIMKTLLRHLGALALGYLAAGLTYIALPIVLSYPTGMLSALAGFSLVTLLYALVTLVSLAVWIGVYMHFIRSWAPKEVAPAPPATPT